MKKGKKYQDSLKLIDRAKQYDPDEAVALVKPVSYTHLDVYKRQAAARGRAAGAVGGRGSSGRGAGPVLLGEKR